MSRFHRIALPVFGLAMIAVLGGLSLMKGGFYGSLYDGDMLHLADIVLRMADGQMPHRDFMTPIGPLAFWPISGLVAAGQGIGLAMVGGQVAMALAILPLALWAAASRFAGWTGFAFLAATCLLPLALVQGGDVAGLSMSMHYNRWAWALAFVAVAVGVLPARREAPILDALAIGLPMAGLVLIKVTYVLALAPAIIVVLAARGDWRRLGAAVAVGIATLGAATAWLGLGFWEGYVTDLLAVANSPGRSYPGLPLGELLVAPGLIAGHALALLSVILLRRGGQRELGLGLLFALPGFVYVTWQNFGHDPVWFVLWGLVLWAALDTAGRRAAPGYIAVAMLALGVPIFSNYAVSPLRHHAEKPGDFRAVFAGTRHDDFVILADRMEQLDMSRAGERDFPEVFARMAEADSREGKPAILGGETLPTCKLSNALVGWFPAIVRDIERAVPEGDLRIFSADLLNPLWIYSDRIAPLEGGTPWHYDGLPGIENATHVFVPLCPSSLFVRSETLAALNARGDLHPVEVARNDLYILLRLDGSAQGAEPEIDDQRGTEGQAHRETRRGPTDPA
ncbi:hypothetical protein E2L08_13860 [Palleronia sediminis]|uniref:Glycosyltransferase RgtA/B/C/D-like domain-containing protein n=1 Tax=Palleronia sediminis TaxID=2547833 RepID=A0A4R6A159_9RHOB|nr:DUF2029 domain-containing protein [Palleronia sediminis]TDL76322.1 hypothetical protein E2L08_13860 [Palleronia sediminis]